MWGSPANAFSSLFPYCRISSSVPSLILAIIVKPWPAGVLGKMGPYRPCSRAKYPSIGIAIACGLDQSFVLCLSTKCSLCGWSFGSSCFFDADRLVIIPSFSARSNTYELSLLIRFTPVRFAFACQNIEPVRDSTTVSPVSKVERIELDRLNGRH